MQIVVLLVWWALSAYVGYRLGRDRGLEWFGVGCSLVFGPFGWIAVGLLALQTQPARPSSAPPARPKDPTKEYRKASLVGADLRLMNLTGKNFFDADLRNADLSGANLSNAILTGADLSGANLSGADLSRASLLNTNLRGANLTRANMTRVANLRTADLTDANLDGVVGLEIPNS